MNTIKQSLITVSNSKADVWTMDDLASIGRKCFTPAPLVTFVEAGYDWDKFCKQADDVQPINDISFSHNFKVGTYICVFVFICISLLIIAMKETS